ncbi:MBL fold metallo-hydrolase [Streptacidiphilus sp. PB12-B1b]|uniref:MBL fold metallo-hydrolase n=1 Tax=Streptacidiphilus sp. PB12-B1b TaxID=2705012 RepID=UPI001CDB826C|nr:MBL fold metallo-hydrolase [Streptacidiphilus sp. PB12-B1b]
MLAWRSRVLPRARDLGGGVWSIPVPIPDNPLRYTLVYALETRRGPVLVDTGWDDPGGRTALADGLGAAGFTPADVHGMLVTHHHPDHHGLSGHVREESGAWIAMHGAEAAVVRAIGSIPAARWGDRMAHSMRGAGVPEEHLRALRGLGGSPGRTGVALAGALPDRELVHGESAGVPGREVRVLWTPGHTPGHVCLYLDEPGHPSRLLSGDHLLPTISPVVSLYPENPGDEPTDPLGDYLDSLERIAALAPEEVLPAHQYRFTDAPARVRALLDHHADRLAELHAQLKHGPLTLWQAAQGMHWNRPWEELGFLARHLALSEAAAHLRRLVKTGLAEEVPGTDPVHHRAL